jgi:regulator of sirC expression with transglutaminase-like and TPR domain
LAFLKTNEYKKALDDCNAAHTLDPKSIKAIWRRISAYRGLKEFKAALDDLAKLKDFGNTIN